jgi:hypothetical protein
MCLSDHEHCTIAFMQCNGQEGVLNMFQLFINIIFQQSTHPWQYARAVKNSNLQDLSSVGHLFSFLYFESNKV